MVGSIFKRAFGTKTMTKKELQKSAKGLNEVYNCVAHFEALEDKRGYDIGKQFPAVLYNRGIQKILLDNWMSPGPNTFTLDTNSYNFNSGIAGCEWAAFLRVRSPDAVVLRVSNSRERFPLALAQFKGSHLSKMVYPRDRTAKAERILCQLISSLIYNFATLVPTEFDKVDSLGKGNFEALAQGGHEGIGAGLRILESLPRLEIGNNNFLCVVDGLNLADEEGTTADVKKLAAVLERISVRHNGHLLYTMAKRKAKG